MDITASKLRSNVYRLLDQVLESGQPLRIRRKGKVLLVVPEEPVSKTGRLTHRHDYIVGDPEELVSLDWSGEWVP